MQEAEYSSDRRQYTVQKNRQKVGHSTPKIAQQQGFFHFHPVYEGEYIGDPLKKTAHKG